MTNTEGALNTEIASPATSNDTMFGGDSVRQIQMPYGFDGQALPGINGEAAGIDAPPSGADTSLNTDSASDANTETPAGDGTGEEDRGPIPYERFQQVNSKYQELSEWDPVLAQLRAEGYDNPQAVLDALQQQQASAQQAQAEADEQAWADQIYERLAVDVEAGRLDPDHANHQIELALQERQLQQDRAMFHDWRQGQEIEHLKVQYPNADFDYVKVMAQATGRPLTELAQASHEQIAAIEQRALARYQATKAADAAIAAPEGAGGSAPAGAPSASNVPLWRQPWSNIFGIGGGSA